jgi:hypothetical protein
MLFSREKIGFTADFLEKCIEGKTEKYSSGDEIIRVKEVSVG